MYIDLDYIKIDIENAYFAGELDGEDIVTQIGKRLHTRDIHEDDVVQELADALSEDVVATSFNSVLQDYECVPKDKNLSLWMKDTETVQKIYDEIKESYHWQHLVK